MEILNYTLSQTPPVIATFSVTIPAIKLTLHKLKVMRSKKGHLFISYPSWMEDNNGQKSFHPYIEFEIEKKKEFEQRIFDHLKYDHQLS